MRGSDLSVEQPQKFAATLRPTLDIRKVKACMLPGELPRERPDVPIHFRKSRHAADRCATTFTVPWQQGSQLLEAIVVNRVHLRTVGHGFFICPSGNPVASVETLIQTKPYSIPSEIPTDVEACRA